MAKAPISNLEDKILPRRIDLPERPITAGPHAKPRRSTRTTLSAIADDIDAMPIDEGLRAISEQFWWR